MSEQAQISYTAMERESQVASELKNPKVKKCKKCGMPEIHINHEEWYHNGQPIDHHFQ